MGLHTFYPLCIHCPPLSQMLTHLGRFTLAIMHRLLIHVPSLHSRVLNRSPEQEDIDIRTCVAVPSLSVMPCIPSLISEPHFLPPQAFWQVCGFSASLHLY